MEDSTKRFSNRVENYVKYRPHYPKEILSFLAENIGLTSEKIVADIGSGTGISTELFLQNGNKVYGIEPNMEMREAAEKYLDKYKYFISVNGTAEDTLLENNSMDVIIAGQAFHWFDVEKAKEEFKRILKENGYVILIWNSRKIDTSDFLIAYEKLLMKFGTDYEKVVHKTLESGDDNTIAWFFAPHDSYVQSFNNMQVFDFEGVKGRLLSSSYAPIDNAEMLEELRNIFDKHNKNGTVEFEYETKVYWGKMK
jgi:SAM-dependent methyltransferase